jgi:hypothetical protein
MAQKSNGPILGYIIRSAVAGSASTSVLLIIFVFTNPNYSVTTVSDRAFIAVLGAILGAIVGVVVWAIPRILKTTIGRFAEAVIGSSVVAILYGLHFGRGQYLSIQLIVVMLFVGVEVGALPGLVARPRAKRFR